jgi:hypothetical protein
MPPRRLPVPRGTFASHAKHLQQKRFASTTPTLPDTAIWRGPGMEPNTRLGQAITGSMEWQTSTYSFNKQAIKSLPVAAVNVEKLIEAYVTMKKVNNKGKDARAIRTALAARRKSAEKMYVSKPRIKDFGNRIEMTVFVFDGKAFYEENNTRRPRPGQKEKPSSNPASKSYKPYDKNSLLSPIQQEGLQSLIARIYSKPVDLRMIPLSKPHLDADILAAYVAQRLSDRRNTPRRVIRDATWKAPLPTAQAMVDLAQKKLQQQPQKFTFQDFMIGNAERTSSTGIVDTLGLSQVSSVQVEAAGRLTKRLTANRSQRKMARRGANAKGPGYMLRGFRKSHVQYAFRGGKRRVGQYGIRVSLGHT